MPTPDRPAVTHGRFYPECKAWLDKRQAEGIGPYTDSDVEFLAKEFSVLAELVHTETYTLGAREMREQWQPIETGPHQDRRMILLLNKDTERYALGWWMQNKDGSGFWTSEGGYIYPTHWMPLPDPPTAALRASLNEPRETDEPFGDTGY